MPPFDPAPPLPVATVAGGGTPTTTPTAPEAEAALWKRRFLATSWAYLSAPLPACAEAPPADRSRGPSSAVLRKRQRMAGVRPA